MGLFNRKKKETTPPPPQQPQQQILDLGKQSGKITLAKGSKVTIAKTPTIIAKATWSSNTDYDIYALVLLKNGKQFVVSTFGSKEQKQPTPTILNGAIQHMGDVGRGVKGQAEESIQIKLTDEILTVVPVAYSAQSNGTGSFRRYKVSLSIDNGAGDTVHISSNKASNNDTIYSCAIGSITNTPNGVTIESLELYSAPGSENRPKFVNGQIVMDAGSQNLYK